MVIDMPTSVFAAWGRLEQLRRRTTRAGAPWWMHNVSERLGALIVLALRRSSISPNTVTVFGLALYLPTAWYLGTRSSVGIGGVIALMLWWQLAFSMDCADGMLARERGQASAFGAWLDQLVDFASHFLVFGSLGVFLVRALALPADEAVMLVAFVLGANLLQVFASSQRVHIMGTAPALTNDRSVLAILARGRQLSDYGALLFTAALLVFAPRALLVLLVVYGALCTLTVLGQVLINWPRAHRQPKEIGVEDHA